MSFEAFGNDSFPFKLKDGNNYDFSALTYGDWAEMENYVKFKDYHTLSKTVSDPEILNRALDRCLDKTVSPSNLQDELDNFNSQQHLLWLAVKKKHPQITKEKLGDLLELTSTAELTQKVMQISVPMSASASGAVPVKKKTGGKKATNN